MLDPGADGDLGRGLVDHGQIGRPGEAQHRAASVLRSVAIGPPQAPGQQPAPSDRRRARANDFGTRLIGVDVEHGGNAGAVRPQPVNEVRWGVGVAATVLKF